MWAAAETVTIDGVAYELHDDGTASVAKQDFVYGDIVIPGTIEHDGANYRVTATVNNAFSSMPISSVTLPEGFIALGDGTFDSCMALTTVTLSSTLQSIGADCFSLCDGLKTIDLPESIISLGDRCFYMGSLQSVSIPKGVTSIGSRCFSYSYSNSLASIVVDPENATYDSRDNCNAIISKATNTMIAACHNTIIPNSVSALGDGCFEGVGISDLEIPENVSSLGISCFALSDLTSITLPKSIIEIKDNCFSSCNLTQITCKNTTPPTIADNAVNSYDRNYIKLYVPEVAIPAYKATPVWQDFEILPIGTTSVDNIKAREAISNGKRIVDGQIVIAHGDKLYNINGQPLAQ